MGDELPRTFGKYQLIKRIAQGGMAELYLARSDGPGGTEKEVAIKRILPQYSQDEEFIGLFLNEARLASMLNHAAVVRIYDLGRTDNTLYIAMEYLEGINLRDLGRTLRGTGRLMPAAIAAAIGARVAEALDYAHRLRTPGGAAVGLVHRDVSADNILLTRDGYVKLLDFGVAKAMALHPLSHSHKVKGKLSYMAPEQIRDELLDGRCDLYALGVTMYLLTTAHFPFGGSNDAAMINNILNAPLTAPSLLVPELPPAFEKILTRMLARERVNRFEDGAEAAAAMNQFARDAGATLTARELAEYLASTTEDAARAVTQEVRPKLHYNTLEPSYAVPPPPPTLAESRDEEVKVPEPAKQRPEPAATQLEGPSTAPSELQLTPLVGTRPRPREWLRSQVVGPIAVALLVIAGIIGLAALRSRNVPCEVSLASDPGADVLVAGRVLGTTPLTVMLPRGRTELKFENEALGLSKRVTLDVTSDENLAFRFGMGKLQIVAPEGWAARVDGNRAGTTPVAALALYEGEHSVELVSQAGVRHAMVVEVRAGDTVTARAGN